MTEILKIISKKQISQKYCNKKAKKSRENRKKILYY